ncbi:MAG: hypothetical protein ACYC62_09530, partial [Coriobacteriia bacterium]
GSLRGLNPPMIGAPSAIIVEGIVERESGATPPPAVTLRTVAVVIAEGPPSKRYRPGTEVRIHPAESPPALTHDSSDLVLALDHEE